MGSDDDPCGVAAGARLLVLTSAAERLDSLADTAELMGDDAGAARLRAAAWNHRLEAMELLDP
jgi:hypothetical protein